MSVTHTAEWKKTVRLSSSHNYSPTNREPSMSLPVIIGLVAISDFGSRHLTTESAIVYNEIAFTPESFSYLHKSEYRQIQTVPQGLDQLLQEV